MSPVFIYTRAPQVLETVENVDKYEKINTAYPFEVKKVVDKPYINMIEMNLYDLMEVYTHIDQIEECIKQKISEIRTPNGNIRLRFQLYCLSFKCVQLLIKNNSKYYPTPENYDCFVILSAYNIYDRVYKIIDDEPEEPTPLFFRVNALLKDISNIDDNEYIIYRCETIPHIKLNRSIEYGYDDEEEQEQNCTEYLLELNEREESPYFNINYTHEAHINFRKTLKINDILNILADSVTPLHFDIYQVIYHHLDDFDITYKEYDNSILNLLSISRAILSNQMEHGNPKPSILLDHNNYYYDRPLRNIHIYNYNDDNINDEDSEEKINDYHDFLTRYNICFRDYNNKIGMYTGIYDIIARLTTLIYTYLDDIKFNYDQDPTECVILNMISFYNDHLFKLVEFFTQKQLIENNNIVDIFIMNAQHQYIFDLMAFNDLEGDIIPEYYFNRLIKVHIPEIKIIRRPRAPTQYIYKGCILMQHMRSFYSIRYKDHIRINNRVRDIKINKIVDLIHANNAGRIFFDRQ